MTTHSRWQDMFEPHRQGGQPPGAPPPYAAQAERPHEAPPDEDGLALDLSVYRPWTIERGRMRPALMLDLRRYEPRSGLWMGWQLSYPTLAAAEYVGDRMLSLDFGTRQFVIEGRALDGLVRDIQRGVVLAVLEHSPQVWGTPPAGPCVFAIKRIGDDAAARGL